MVPENKSITVCPSCKAKYRVLDTFEGKTVSCKTCGSKFRIVFLADAHAMTPFEGAAEGDDPGGQASRATGFELLVSEDKLEAHIVSKGKIPETLTPEDLAHWIEGKGIRLLSVDAAQMEDYLRDAALQREPWKIAEGRAPIPGRGEEIKYFFDTDPLKIGALKEGGVMDFRDRGEVPQVGKGDLLAEIVPAQEGTPGVDVYGQSIPTPKPGRVKIRSGQGVEKSGDGARFLARIDGKPEISLDGKLSVLPVLEVSGDVGLETGHVNFDGHIQVRGSVQGGFRVKGDRLSAQEILEAEIDVDGDVVVLGGVLGANIKAGGNFRGRYVHSANIQVAGDVLVETEVMDSTIITGGRCIVERGKILASSIFSKQGVRAPEVGSGACKACSLTVGVDEITDRETDRLRTQIVEKEKRQRDLKAHRDGLQEKSGKLNADLGELAQVQDRNMVQQRTLQEKMDALRKLEDREQLAEVEASMASLDSQIRENESRLDRMLDEQDGMTHKISESQNEIDTLQGEIEKLKEEIASFEGWSRSEKGSPVIRVSGKVFAGTVIRGLRSSLILQEDYEHVLIAETRVNTPDSGSEWKMVVSPLK